MPRPYMALVGEKFFAPTGLRPSLFSQGHACVHLRPSADTSHFYQKLVQ